MLGYSNGELLAMGISDIEASEKPEKIVARIRKMLIDGHDRFEARHCRNDDSVVDVEINLVMVAD